MVYKRIAVADTGSQKLSVHFFDAFKFIGTLIVLLLTTVLTSEPDTSHGAIHS